MFHLCIFLFSVLLFFVLTPGILLTIPAKGSKNVVALVHALVFATVLHFTHKLVWHATEAFEEQMPAELSPEIILQKIKLEKDKAIKSAQEANTV